MSNLKEEPDFTAVYLSITFLFQVFFAYIILFYILQSHTILNLLFFKQTFSQLDGIFKKYTLKADRKQLQSEKDYY